MAAEETVPGDVTHFLNRASIDELMMAKEREVAKGPMHARWQFVRAIDAELEGRKASNRRPRLGDLVLNDARRNVK